MNKTDANLLDGGSEEQSGTRKNRKRFVFEAIYFGITLCFMLVMLITGWNFFPLVGLILACVSGLLIFFSVLKGKGAPFVYRLSYLVVVCGTLLFFLIRSAEPFGKRLWWNLIFTAVPIALCIAVKYFEQNDKKHKIFQTLVAFLMTGTLVVYFFFMDLRLTPTVERMWDGHDEYLASLSASKTNPNSPNVLFILMDDMGYSDISSYSYLGSEEATINTPNIDSIGANGIYMENFYASAPVCTPSRFSALTGRYAARGYLDNVIFPTTVESDPYSMTHFVNPYQFLNNVDGILGDEITVAEALGSLGYYTSCVGKWNLGDYGEYLPTNQGFDYFYGSYYVNDMTPYDWVEEKDGKATEVRSSYDNKDQSESTRIFTDKVNEEINKAVDGGDKFFMFYTTPWPHYPVFSDNNGNGKGDTSDDTYIDCIEEFDRCLGEILDNLKEKGVYDDTLIIFTSDNGPGREGVTGSLRGRKNTTFEGGMKVPMLVSYPNGGVGGGSKVPTSDLTIRSLDGTTTHATTERISSSAMITDIFPTILNYVMGDDYALPTDRIIDGVSLKELWSGNLEKDYRVHDALYYMKRGKVQGVQMPAETSLGTFDFKYYDNVHSENSAFIDQFYKNYLFNLDTDPAEGYNVAKTYPEIAEQLDKKLNAFRDELKSNRRGIKRR